MYVRFRPPLCSCEEQKGKGLVEAIVALQGHVEKGTIQSYGICSNGVCLPKKHPLYMDPSDIRIAAEQAKAILDQEELALDVLELPTNLLETTGIEIARDNNKPTKQVYGMRPLSCYPDRGTGTGHPFVMADYLLPATMDKKLVWSNVMHSPPQVYQLALKTAMMHFDAQDIIQAKLDGKDLSSAERETLDGCKLLQSLLHDVDAGLDKLRSFS
jgi:hypothetical protein